MLQGYGAWGLFFILWGQGHFPVRFLPEESFDLTELSRDNSDVHAGPIFPGSFQAWLTEDPTLTTMFARIVAPLQGDPRGSTFFFEDTVVCSIRIFSIPEKTSTGHFFSLFVRWSKMFHHGVCDLLMYLGTSSNHSFGGEKGSDCRVKG